MKFKIIKNLKTFIGKYYSKLIALVLVLFSIYTIYFLYQNFYLVLLKPQLPDLTSYEQSQVSMGADSKFDLIESLKAERMAEDLNTEEIRDPFNL
ncbi:MAG: hypothetical protein ABIB97_00995 [Patescibacteria group bacterium]